MDAFLQIAAVALVFGVPWLIGAGWDRLTAWEAPAAVRGAQTVFPTKRGIRALVWFALGLIVALTLAFPTDWPVCAIGALLVLLAATAIPGEIVVDSRGIESQRRWLLPGWKRRLRWPEIDSAFERSLAQMGEGRSVTEILISAGPRRSIRFTQYHSDRNRFVEELRKRQVPLGVRGGE